MLVQLRQHHAQVLLRTGGDAETVQTVGADARRAARLAALDVPSGLPSASTTVTERASISSISPNASTSGVSRRTVTVCC